MGLVSPIASANRRMAPFSTSLMAGFDSRPVALRSTTKPPLPARGQGENRDEPGLRALDEGGRGDHRPRGGSVAWRAAGNDEPDAGVADQLDLISRVRSAQPDDELQVGHFLAVVERARDLAHADDASLGHHQSFADDV